MYNKYLTQTISEYNKIQKCIESSETENDYDVCLNMRDLFLDNVHKRLHTLYKSKNWISRKINFKHKQEVKNYDNIASLMMSNLDNTLQSIYQDINEENADQIKREKRQYDIISDSQAYRDGYKPHIVVTGFKIND